MKRDKFKIEKNTVQETLMMPLYAKCYAMKRWPGFFFDEECLDIIKRVDYDFSKLKEKNKSMAMELAAVGAASRQLALAAEIRDYLREKPNAQVVLLGCGLDTTGHQADNKQCSFVNFDLPNVIELRESIITGNEREKNIPADLTDHSWFDKLEYNEDNGAVFAASGMFMYWKRNEVRSLFKEMAEAFLGARIAFDAQNKRGVDIDLKTVKKAGVDISMNFYLNKPFEELSSWNIKYRKISCKKMMADYKRLDKRFSFIARLLADYCDSTGMSQLNVIDF